MIWTAIAGYIAAAGAALLAFAYAAWASKRIDSLHAGWREAAVVAQAAKGEVAQLHESLRATNDLLVDARRTRRDESALVAGLDRAREQYATPPTVPARRPLPSSLPTGQQKALTPRPKPASDNDATTRMPPSSLRKETP